MNAKTYVVGPLSERAVQRALLAVRREMAQLIGNGALAKETLASGTAGGQRKAAERILEGLPAKLEPITEAYLAFTQALADGRREDPEGWEYFGGYGLYAASEEEALTLGETLVAQNLAKGYRAVYNPKTKEVTIWVRKDGVKIPPTTPAELGCVQLGSAGPDEDFGVRQ